MHYKILITISFLLFIQLSSYGFCSCSEYYGFIKGAKYANIIVKGTIKNIDYTFENGQEVNTIEQRDEYYKNNKGKVYNHLEILELENIEILKGDENIPELKLRILGGTMHSCMSTLDNFKNGNEYIFLLDESDSFFRDEMNFDYFKYNLELRPCCITEAEYIAKRKSIKIRRKNSIKKYRYLSLRIFKRKIRKMN